MKIENRKQNQLKNLSDIKEGFMNFIPRSSFHGIYKNSRVSRT